jgi:hypothetical protein
MCSSPGSRLHAGSTSGNSTVHAQPTVMPPTVAQATVAQATVAHPTVARIPCHDRSAHAHSAHIRSAHNRWAHARRAHGCSPGARVPPAFTGLTLAGLTLARCTLAEPSVSLGHRLNRCALGLEVSGHVGGRRDDGVRDGFSGGGYGDGGLKPEAQSGARAQAGRTSAILPNVPGARAWQAHAAHIDQVNGGGGDFTCRAPPIIRFGGVGVREDLAAVARAQLADNVDDAMPVGGCTGGGMGLR